MHAKIIFMILACVQNAIGTLPPFYAQVVASAVGFQV